MWPISSLSCLKAATSKFDATSWLSVHLRPRQNIKIIHLNYILFYFSQSTFPRSAVNMPPYGLNTAADFCLNSPILYEAKWTVVLPFLVSSLISYLVSSLISFHRVSLASTNHSEERSGFWNLGKVRSGFVLGLTILEPSFSKSRRWFHCRLFPASYRYNLCASLDWFSQFRGLWLSSMCNE